MFCVGIDEGNSQCGVGIIEASDMSRPPPVRFCCSVGMPGSAGADAGSRKVVELISPYLLEPARVRIERAPDRVRADVKHGSQANVGWTLGYLAGRLSAHLELSGHDVGLIPVSVWRQTMLELSARWGAPVDMERAAQPSAGPSQARKVQREGDVLCVVWEGCGHKSDVGSFERLLRFSARTCPVCLTERSAPRPLTDAEERSDRWKRVACDGVRRHWPDTYVALIADARSRSRVVKEDHRLAGVSDACEALWIAAAAATV
jgi:hypothetical protein